ncbi:MAG: phosphatase PAP2 family protein [Muribaculaceae bacterium]|nr:phosphatase PAP2 family protein [Muribaculaceae bacterium]
MNKKIWIWLLLAVIITASNARANHENRYLQGEDMPNPLIYLPGPPDSTMLATNGDYAKWIWGKEQRNTPRGEQASWESKFGMVRMITIYSDVLGIDISEDATPAIYRLMYRAGDTGSGGVSEMKKNFFRKRPFLIMNENTWGQFDKYDELSISSAYPSSHTGWGWGTALALAEMAPHMQDTILRRGYEYGISRVIVGAHWQSDVDAAITCASAAIARSRATTDYQADMAAARTEYMQIKGLTENDMKAKMPVITKILDAPSTTDDYLFVGDLFSHWQAIDLQSTERGELAKEDFSIDDNYLINTFADCSPVVTISETETPCIVMLIKVLKLSLNTHATSLKSMVQRKRPFVQLNEPVPYSGDEWPAWGESSYPSRRALLGWGIALALAEVMPDCQNEILKRGYEYGDSRIILGSNYASDVIAARVMAACDLGKLHNESVFKTLFYNAEREYQEKIDEAGIESVIATSRLNDTLWYSIKGEIYDSKPSTPGIYINKGKKVVIR